MWPDLDPESEAAHQLDQALEYELLYGDELDPEPRPAKTCRHCLCGGLHWQQTEKGWRLFTSQGEIHHCSRYRRPLA